MKDPQIRNALDVGLRAVAEDDGPHGASSAVGMRLMAEVHAIGAARRRRVRLLSLGGAVLSLALLIPVWWVRAPAENTTRPVDEPLVARELVTEFFPLAYGNVPTRGGYVIRMQVPSSVLARFGAAAFADDRQSPHVQADIVIGNDGLARAVRFVRVIDDSSPVGAGHQEQEQTP